jgi:hypothetical protein
MLYLWRFVNFFIKKKKTNQKIEKYEDKKEKCYKNYINLKEIVQNFKKRNIVVQCILKNVQVSHLTLSMLLKKKGNNFNGGNPAFNTKTVFLILKK